MVVYGACAFFVPSAQCELACVLDIQNEAVEGLCDKPGSEELNSWLKNKRVGVVCHGLLSHKGSRPMIMLSELLLHNVEHLDAVVRFDFRGNGESSGYDQWSYGGYQDEVEDVRNVILRLMRGHAIVPILLGHSRAASVVVLYGCRYKDVPRIVSLAGRVDMACQSTVLFSNEQLDALARGESVTVSDKGGNSRHVSVFSEPTCHSRVLINSAQSSHLTYYYGIPHDRPGTRFPSTTVWDRNPA